MRITFTDLLVWCLHCVSSIWVIAVVWNALFGGDFLPISGQIILIVSVPFWGFITDVMLLKLQKVMARKNRPIEEQQSRLAVNKRRIKTTLPVLRHPQKCATLASEHYVETYHLPQLPNQTQEHRHTH